MDNLDKLKNEKRAEIDSAKKSRMHIYLDETDVYMLAYDRTRLQSIADSMGTVEVGTGSLDPDCFRLLVNKMQSYEQQLLNTVVAKYRAIAAAETEDVVSAISTEDGYPEEVRITTAELEAEAQAIKDAEPAQMAISFAKTQVNAVELTANQALQMQGLFPIWGQDGAEFGKSVAEGFRFQYKKESELKYKLYEVISQHTLQENWEPDGLMDLYKVVTVEHAGTLEDPIPYTQGMAFEKGKYYEQYGVIYLCILTTETGYPSDLKDLHTIVTKVE